MSHMRRRLCAVGCSLAVVAAIAYSPAQAAVAAVAADGGTLYVNNTTSACTDSGSGTVATPFCTIQAAADVAGPGDTVLITGNDLVPYPSATIASSGTASAPITFHVTGAPYFFSRHLTVTGSYVEISGAEADDEPSVTVDGSHVVLDHSQFAADVDPAVVVGKNVSALTIERSWFSGFASASLLQLGAGDTGTVIAEDIFNAGYAVVGQVALAPVISLSGDSDTDVTGNTIYSACGVAVSVAGSTGTSVENDIVSAAGGCHVTGKQAVTVDAASAGSTVEGYNVLSTVSGGLTPYAWAGKTYTTQAAFAAATGQGANDDVVSSLLIGPESGPAYASANASAPGELTTDFYGNAWSGTPDRGAVELIADTDPTLYAFTFAPQTAQISLSFPGPDWNMGSYTVNWGDGTPADTEPISTTYAVADTDFAAYHTYSQVGTYPVTVTYEGAAGTVTKTASITTTGSTYVPVNPTRVLDTRHGTGAPLAPVGPHGTVAVDIDASAALPANSGAITAVVLNVTATDETGNGIITAYPDGSALPDASNVNFGAHENIANLVTVMVGADGKVDLNNGSSASTDMVADVEGYYVQSATGSYYASNTPKRVLDTRSGTGGTTGPVSPGGIVSLSVPTCTDGGTSAPAVAVALNVTAVGPSANGFITVYPDQASVPTASNVNYATGQNTPNLVVVKVGSDGKVDFYNAAGSLQIVADLEGCYSSTLGGAFVPVAPYRSLDTRSGLGQNPYPTGPAGPDAEASWVPLDTDPTEGAVAETAEVMNVTVTQPKASGFITAYDSSHSPPNASNLNFHAGDTVPNLVMVGPNPGLYNSSTGTTELIVDMFGYFT